MKRVLQVVYRMGYGGIETFLMNIYRNIDRNKIQFDFAVNTTELGDYDEEIKKMGGNIYYITPRRKSIFTYKKDWNDFLKENSSKYSSIHMHISSLTTIFPLKVAKKYSIKNRFVHAHNTFQKGFLHKVLSNINKIRIKRYATKCFACSTEAGRYVYGNNSFELIHNAIDLKNFEYSYEKRLKIRQNLNIKDEKIILHVGRFAEQKNHNFLIDIFKEIVITNPEYKLYLIGSGELKEQIYEKVKKENLEEKVKFIGNVPNVNEYMIISDIFLFPSLHEGLPVVVVEAQATGLKCILSDRITKEVKITNLVEYLSLNNNPIEWKDKVIKSSNYARKIQSKEIKKEKYDIESVVNIFSYLYLN